MKRILLLVILLVSFTVSGCKKNGNFQALTMEELEIKLENNEDFTFVIKSSYCSHCKAYQPIIEEYVEDTGIVIYYIDLADEEDPSMTDEKIMNLKAKIEAINSEYDKVYTPVTVKVEDGEIIEAMIGYVEYSDLEDFMN